MGDGCSYLTWCWKVHLGWYHLFPQVDLEHWAGQLIRNKCWVVLSWLLPFPILTDQVPAGANISPNVSQREYERACTHAILKPCPQIVFSSWFSQFCHSPRELLIPTAISTPRSHILLVFPAVFLHFLFGFHVLHWTSRSLQFTGHRISQVISPSLWRVSHLIWFLRTHSYLMEDEPK